MIIRPGTSDELSFRQVYQQHEFAPLADLYPATVLDLGAYIGLASAWFLDNWPDCQVIAVEPDPDNAAILTRNVEPWSDRVTIVRAAAWPTCERLRLDEQYRGPGREWSRRVRRCVHGEASDVQGYTVPQLVEGWQRIGLLKVDIEGAERELFRDAPWLDRVDAIAAEIGHGVRGAMEVFMRAIEGRGYTVTHSGELTICRR